MLCAVLVCVALAGCTLGKDSVPLTFDDPLEAKLFELAEQRRPARLADLTDFPWDEVHIFYEGDSRAHVEQVVGSRVFRDKFYSSSGGLMVFENGGEVVKAVAMTGEFLRSDRPSWSTEVMLEPFGNGYLRLTAP